MKNTYATPSFEVVSVEASSVIAVSTGDIEVGVDNNFF